MSFSRHSRRSSSDACAVSAAMCTLPGLRGLPGLPAPLGCSRSQARMRRVASRPPQKGIWKEDEGGGGRVGAEG